MLTRNGFARLGHIVSHRIVSYRTIELEFRLFIDQRLSYLSLAGHAEIAKIPRRRGYDERDKGGGRERQKEKERKKEESDGGAGERGRQVKKEASASLFLELNRIW